MINYHLSCQVVRVFLFLLVSCFTFRKVVRVFFTVWHASSFNHNILIYYLANCHPYSIYSRWLPLMTDSWLGTSNLIPQEKNTSQPSYGLLIGQETAHLDTWWAAMFRNQSQWIWALRHFSKADEGKDAIGAVWKREEAEQKEELWEEAIRWLV